MFDVEEVLEIHQMILDETGGLSGLRDEGSLQSALERPFSGFGETEFYPTPIEKSAAIMESVVINHPFNDGNKRIGYYLMRAILLHFKLDINATEDEKYNFVIAVASGKTKYEEIVDWLKNKVVEI